MSPTEIIIALCAVLALLGNIAVTVYFFGRMSQSVESHGKWLESLDEQVTDHEKRIGRVEGGKARVTHA